MKQDMLSVYGSIYSVRHMKKVEMHVLPGQDFYGLWGDSGHVSPLPLITSNSTLNQHCNTEQFTYSKAPASPS